MLTREKLIKKVESLYVENLYKKPKPLRLIVTVVKLPSGALETIVNNQDLDEKIKYILGAYDDNLRLKTCKEIELVDCIIL